MATEIFTWIAVNWQSIIEIYLGIVGVASIIVKLTPTLADDLWLKKVVAFIGKYLALNKTITPDEQATVNAKYLNAHTDTKVVQKKK